MYGSEPSNDPDITAQRLKRQGGFTNIARALQKGVNRHIITNDQLERKYRNDFDVGGRNPLTRFHNLSLLQTSLALKYQQAAEKINLSWRELERKDRVKGELIAEIMHDATYYGIHPELGFDNIKHKHLWGEGNTPPTLKELKARQEHVKLQKKYKALGVDGRKIYKQVEAFHKDLRNDQRRAMLKHLAEGYNLDEKIPPKSTDPRTKLGKPKPSFDDLIKATTLEQMERVIEPYVDKDQRENYLAAAKGILEAGEVAGPYFPLRRFGDYVVECFKKDTLGPFKAEVDANTAVSRYTAQGPAYKATKIKLNSGYWEVRVSEQVFAAFNSEPEAAASAKEIQAQGYTNREGDNDIQVTQKRDWAMPPDSSAKELLSVITRKLDENDPAQQVVKEAFIRLMTESTLAKSSMQRNYVAGASLDMRRAFAERARAGAWSVADIYYSLEKTKQLAEMRSIADTKAMHPDTVTLANVVDEFHHRDSVNLSQRRIGVIDRTLSQVGFMGYLASAHYSIINATQPWLVTQPYLAAKYGQAAAYKTLTASYKGVFAAGTEELNRIKWGFNINREGPELMVEKIVNSVAGPGEKQTIQMLEELGIIDATAIKELFRTAEGTAEPSTVGGKAASAAYSVLMTGARSLPQVVEIANRVVTARAAYKLESEFLRKDKRKNYTDAEVHKIASDAAREAVLLTQFNYADQNKPPSWRRTGVRSALMFRMYSQGLSMLFFTNSYAAVVNDPSLDTASQIEKKRQARALLGGLMLNHGLAAGAFSGLAAPPLWAAYKVIETVANIIGDEDEPWEPELLMHEGLAEIFGNGFANIVSRGIPHAFGVDLRGNLGLESLIVMGRSAGAVKSAEDKTEDLMLAIFGPVGGMLRRAMRGADYVDNGQLMKGLEYMYPIKLVQNLSRAARYATQGATDYSGNVIGYDFGAYDTFVRAIGFQSDTEALMYEGRKAGAEYDQRARAQRAKLMSRWRNSDGQNSTLLDDIREYNTRFPETIILPDNLQQSLSAKAEREAKTRHGLYAESHEARRRAALYGQN
jgi:hypothetical protein